MRNLMSEDADIEDADIEDATQGTLTGLLCAAGVALVLVVISAIARGM